MGCPYAGIVFRAVTVLLLILVAACSQSTTQQKIIDDPPSLPSADAALAYLSQRPELSANRNGVQCRKYENVIEGISDQSRFFSYEDLYIYTASIKVSGNDARRECLLIGAQPYKNNAFMVGNHRSLREFFNLNRFAPKVWFRYFAVYECSDAGGRIDGETAIAFLALGASVLDEATLDER
jgi:hypothetical protein